MTGGMTSKEVSTDLEDALKILMSRKLLTREKRTNRMIQLTPEGQKVKKSQLDLLENEVFKLTSEMIKTGSWESALPNLKKYNIAANGPRIQMGKTHPITNLINEIRGNLSCDGIQRDQGPDC